jgi:hypothetical protein
VSPDDSAMPNDHTGQDGGATAKPNVVADVDAALAAAVCTARAF